MDYTVTICFKSRPALTIPGISEEHLATFRGLIPGDNAHTRLEYSDGTFVSLNQADIVSVEVGPMIDNWSEPPRKLM